MVTLIIMDGFGIREQKEGNAILLAGTKKLDKLKKQYPYTTLKASGEAVGLTNGQMGNSEVGHLNIGAGRVVLQDLMLINSKIESGEFFENKAILSAISHTKKYNSNLHILGLCSDGGVHSHINHLMTLIDMVEKNKVKKTFLHLITDGRDTLKDSAIKYIEQIKNRINGTNISIADIMGRVYAMDRENRWDRIKLAYDMLVNSKNEETNKNPISVILKNNYNQGVFDEFIKPIKISNDSTISENDAVIFFNYRTDRAREITNAITQKSFNKFETTKFKNLKFVCFTSYDETFKNVDVAFLNEKIKDNLSSVISKNKLTQFHISETTKYAHVTFFVNGGIEKPYSGEDRMLVESKDVLKFDDFPQMRAKEITKKAIEAIKSKKYDFVLINLSNPDMLGHTGNIKATKKAIKLVDRCAYKIAMQTKKINGDCIITADHGNAEYMLDEKGNSITSHTTNPVPFYLVSNKFKNAKLKTGKLGNIAPTVLKILNVKKPKTMIDDLFE